MLSVSLNGEIKIWNYDSGECTKQLSLDHSNTMKLWNIESGECLRTFDRNSNSNVVSEIVKHSNEKLFIYFGESVKLWDINTGECIMNVKHEDSGTYLQPLDINKIISYNQDNEIKIWNLDTGKCVKSLKGHTSLLIQVEILN